MKDGLTKKYSVTHADGTPADPHGMYFAMKLNSRKYEHAVASQAAALVYAESIERTNPELAADLRTTVMQLRNHGDSPLWKGACQMVPLPNLYQQALYAIATKLDSPEEMRHLAQEVLSGKANEEALKKMNG